MCGTGFFWPFVQLHSTKARPDISPHKLTNVRDALWTGARKNWAVANRRNPDLLRGITNILLTLLRFPMLVTRHYPTEQ